MHTRFRRLPMVLALVFLAAASAGCNIFGFTSDKEKSPTEKAEEAIRDGNYQKAIDELTVNGVLKDSTDSMSLYIYSKAVLLNDSLNISRFIDLIQAKNASTATGSLSLLDEIDKLDIPTQNKWYHANTEIAIRLARIWDGKTTGAMTRDDIALDYSVSSILGGVLSLRDTHHDGVIDNRDIRINLSEGSRVISGGTVKGFDFSGITGPNPDKPGEMMVFKGLTAFLGAPGSVPKRAKPSGVAGYTPDEINPLIANFLSFLEGGQKSIDYFVENLAKNTSYDAEDIKKYIPEIARIINCYWYDDGVDNDGDGVVDEEEIDGKDNDGDGLIDEDSHYMKDYDSTSGHNTQYIPIWQYWSEKK